MDIQEKTRFSPSSSVGKATKLVSLCAMSRRRRVQIESRLD